MFPIYWKILKASLGLAFLVLVGGSIATAAAGKTSYARVSRCSFRYPGVALMTFAWITLAFSALEFFGGRFQMKDSWDPRQLPPLMKTDPAQVAFRTDHTARDPNHFQRLVAGRIALSVPPTRPWHCLSAAWSGLANHLSAVCGVGGCRFRAHRIHAGLAACGRRAGPSSRLVMSALSLVVDLLPDQRSRFVCRRRPERA